MPAAMSELTLAIKSIGGDGMAGGVAISDSMAGNVGSHAGHIVGWTGGENPSPIYCSGHSVNGTQQTGSSKVIMQGRPAARKGDTGSSSCPCDGQGYTIDGGSSKVFIEGRPAARIGDSVNIHGQGSGRMTTGSSKVIIGG